MSNQLAGTIFKEDSLIIQHDWQRSLESDKDKFFVNLKKFGEKTVSFEIKCEAGRLKQEDDEKVKGELNGKTIVLNADNLSRKFVSPYIEFGSVHKSSINSVDISPSENMMVSSDASGEFIVSDTRRANRLRDLEGHIYEVYCSRFFPSGMVVLSGGMDMTVRVFSVEDAWNARTMKGHKAAVHDLGFFGEGAEVVSCSKDGTVKVWSCASGEFIHDFHPEIGQLHSLSVNNVDQNLVGTGGESRKAVIYDIRSGNQIHSFEVDSSCNAVTFNSETGFYAGTAEGSVFAFDLRNQRNSTLVKTQRGAVHRLLYNETIGLVAGFHDGTVAGYKNSLDGGQSYIEFTGSDCDPIYDLSIAGSTLVTACRDKAIRLYKIN